jgi:hypothetical protein
MRRREETSNRELRWAACAILTWFSRGATMGRMARRISLANAKAKSGAKARCHQADPAVAEAPTGRANLLRCQFSTDNDVL